MKHHTKTCYHDPIVLAPGIGLSCIELYIVLNHPPFPLLDKDKGKGVPHSTPTVFAQPPPFLYRCKALHPVNTMTSQQAIWFKVMLLFFILIQWFLCNGSFANSSKDYRTECDIPHNDIQSNHQIVRYWSKKTSVHFRIIQNGDKV